MRASGRLRRLRRIARALCRLPAATRRALHKGLISFSPPVPLRSVPLPYIRAAGGLDAPESYNARLPANPLTMQEIFDSRAVEREAQKFWEERRSFRAEETPGKPKFYC